MTDSEFIDKHGGTTKFARLIGVRVNVVTNWRTRGIPAYIKVTNPELFFGASKVAEDLEKVVIPQPTTQQEATNA